MMCLCVFVHFDSSCILYVQFFFHSLLLLLFFFAKRTVKTQFRIKTSSPGHFLFKLYYFIRLLFHSFLFFLFFFFLFFHFHQFLCTVKKMHTCSHIFFSSFHPFDSHTQATIHHMNKLHSFQQFNWKNKTYF